MKSAWYFMDGMHIIKSGIPGMAPSAFKMFQRLARCTGVPPMYTPFGKDAMTVRGNE
jgi:hypothetical protein